MSREENMMVVTINTEEIRELTLEELCELCDVTPDFIEEILEQGIVEPRGQLNALRFSENDLRHIRTILHLQQDLDVNVAGAALVIDLMNELDQLRSRVEILEKYLAR